MSTVLSAPLPRVLCLSGWDPSGGAGLQADIEAVAALGGHALGLISALTVQDTHNVKRLQPVESSLLIDQLSYLLADCPPQALKFGLLSGAEQITALSAALQPLHLPAVCDPVLRAGGGHDFDNAGLIPALRRKIFPWMTLITPNAAEARRLVPEATTLVECAQRLLDDGCNNVLITGGDEPGSEVVNIWYRANTAAVEFRWPRLPETFHGAGCTLAAAIACRLAAGDEISVALTTAQQWTHATLQHAFAVGHGRRIPWRRAASAT